MATLLRIDASARTEGSHSRALADEVEAGWLRLNPDGEVVSRNLAQDPVALITNDTIAGYYTPADELTDELRQATALSDQLIAEIMAADSLLISTPMYNFSIPAVLKAWVDQIVRINHTFGFDPATGLVGLIKNKSAYVSVAMGAQFTGTPIEGYDFVRPYMKSLLGFLGFEQVEIFSLEATTTDEQQINTGMQEAVQQIKTAFSSAGKAVA
jgi:FMN-dependent NADH-azoreductase